MFSKEMETRIIGGYDTLGDDHVFYASLLFTIDKWLMENLYDAYGDPLEPTLYERITMARLCLRYFMKDLMKSDSINLISDMRIAGWLEEHSNCEADDEEDFELLDLYADVCNG